MKTKSEIQKTAQALVSQGRGAKGALANRGEALLEQAIALKAKIARDFWELGRVLAAMRNEGVATALGFASLEALADARLGMKKSTLWKLVAVAEQLPRAEAVRLGVEKAYALVAYAKATPEDDSAAALAKGGATIDGKPLARVTVKELRGAGAAAKPKRPPTLAEVKEGRDDRALVKRIVAHVATVGIPKSVVVFEGDEIHIRLSRRQARRMLGD